MNYLRYDLVYQYRKRHDNIMLWLARHLPKELKMWVVVDAFAKATVRNNKTPEETGYSDVMKVFRAATE